MLPENSARVAVKLSRLRPLRGIICISGHVVFLCLLIVRCRTKCYRIREQDHRKDGVLRFLPHYVAVSPRLRFFFLARFSPEFRERLGEVPRRWRFILNFVEGETVLREPAPRAYAHEDLICTSPRVGPDKLSSSYGLLRIWRTRQIVRER